MDSWIRDALSREQQLPLEREARNANIFAVAGSGKTRTMVYMILADLAEGVPPSEIIAFTFTEKAADELLSRVHVAAERHLGEIDLAGLSIGTIHNWCFQFLLEQRDFYNFDPIDELHSDALVSRIYDQIDLESAYGLSFPRAVTPFLEDVELFYNENLDLVDVPVEKRDAIEAYTDLIQRNRLLPFGAMIRNATKYLEEAGPLEDLSRLYVDEYQDVNPAQVRLIQNMLPDTGELVAVGDDMQCIYQWRGSDVHRIIEFTEDFPGSTTFTMETNYRSRPAILALANEINANMELAATDKQLHPDRESTSADAVNWLSFANEADQAAGIAEIVERYLDAGVPPSEMAVLIRKHSMGREIVDALEARDVPVDSPALRRGGAFIEAFVKPTLDWLSEPHEEPRNEVERQELEQEVEALEESVRPWVETDDGESLGAYWDAVHAWDDEIAQQSNDAYNIRGQLYELLERCGIAVGVEDSDLMMGVAITSQIIRSVEEVHRRRLDTDHRRSPRSVIRELSYAIDRNQETFGETDEIEIPARGVTVNSVHQAKGLEWPIVFVPSLNTGDFPVQPRGHGTSFPDEIAARYGTSIDDERRLFYVATTRAEERLFLLDTSASAEGNRSQFLTELDAEQGLEPTPIEDITDATWERDWDGGEGEETPELIGLSDLLLYIECPYQFGLRRQANIEPAIGDELGYGEGLHELIQRRAEADDAWDDDTRSERVREHVHLPYMSEAMESRSAQGIEERLETLEGLDVLDADSETEIPVDVVFEHGVVHGEIDYVENTDDGMLLRDWKSNLNHEELLPRYERQLQFYAHVLRNRGETVTRAELVDVGATNSASSLQVREVDVSDDAIDSLIASITQALDGIQNDEYGPTPSPDVCASCDMEQLCPYSQAE